MSFRKHSFKWVLLALLLAWPVTRLASIAATWLDYPYPHYGTEGLVLYESLLFKRGGDVYEPITSGRFISGPFPPIYYWITAATLPGDLPDFTQPGNVASVFKSGRLASLLSAFIAAALIPFLIVLEGGYHLLGRRTSWAAALVGSIGGMLFLYLPSVLVWSTHIGGEMTSLALTTAGLVCVAAGANAVGRSAGVDEQHGLKMSSGVNLRSAVLLAMGAVFFALAFFTHISLVGPLAAAAYLLIRSRKVGLAWSGVMAAFIVVPFAILDWITGHWLYLHLFEYHSNLISRAALGDLLSLFWEDHWPLILIAVAYILYRLSQFRSLRGARSLKEVPLLVPIFTAISLLTLPFGASLGAEHNRLLLPGLALCASVVAGLAAFLVRREEVNLRGWPMKWVAPAAAGLLIVYALVTSWPSSAYNRELATLSANQMEQMRKITLNLKLSGGNLHFSDEPGLLALAGKETPFNDPSSMTIMSLRGKWDESAYRDMLRRGQFSLLVLSCDITATPQAGSDEQAACPPTHFTPGVLDAMNAGYTVLFYDIFSTYAPR
jgi:hypothetical protein